MLFAAAVGVSSVLGGLPWLAWLRLALSVSILYLLFRSRRRPVGRVATILGALALMGAAAAAAGKEGGLAPAISALFVLCWWVRRSYIPWVTEQPSWSLVALGVLGGAAPFLAYAMGAQGYLRVESLPPLPRFFDIGSFAAATSAFFMAAFSAWGELIHRTIRRSSIRTKLVLSFGLFAVTPAVLVAVFLGLASWLHAGDRVCLQLAREIQLSSRAAPFMRALRAEPMASPAGLAARLERSRDYFRSQGLSAVALAGGRADWRILASEGRPDSLFVPASSVVDDSAQAVGGLVLRAERFYWAELAIWPTGRDSLALVTYQPVDTSVTNDFSRATGVDFLMFSNASIHRTRTGVTYTTRGVQVAQVGEKPAPGGVHVSITEDSDTSRAAGAAAASRGDSSGIQELTTLGGGRYAGRKLDKSIQGSPGLIDCRVWNGKVWRSASAVVLVRIGLLDALGLQPDKRYPLALGVRLTLLVIAVLFLIVEIVSLVFGSRVAGFITRGVTNLRQAANAIGQGNFDVHVTVPSEDEFGELASTFNKMTNGLRLGREAVIEREHLKRELDLARKIQIRLLPSGPPVIPRIDIAAANAMSQQVGGDYYDYIAMAGGRVGLCIADVSGHGVSAAILMSSVKAAFVSCASVGSDPGDITGRVNRLLEMSIDPGKFVTGFFATLDPVTLRMQYVNAGHPAPMVLRANGALARLDVGGLILGIDSTALFEEGQVDLAQGDVVMFFTDGVTEAQGEDDELYGDERIEALLRRDRDLPAEQILQKLVEEVKVFEGERGPSDDLTAMVMRVV